MLIDCKVIPHSEQRCDTVGDWWFNGDYTIPLAPHLQLSVKEKPTLHIRVSKLSDPRYELLVFHHEFTEALLCQQMGVTEGQVDEWDRKYELTRVGASQLLRREKAEAAAFTPCGCEITETSEPGDDPHCPYFEQHKAATLCERVMAATLGVNWAAYEKEVEEL